MNKFLFISALAAAGLSACSQKSEELPLVSPDAFRTEIDGKPVDLYTLRSSSGMTVQITNFGAHVVSLWVPDKDGKMGDVALGHNTLEEYKSDRFCGAVVGRYANRVADGRFSIDGKEYQLPQNDNGQCLHGGLKGLDSVVWTVDSVADDEIWLSYLSPDGEDGFPGNLKVEMTYKVNADNELVINYDATTDDPTVINLSNHTFFNLSGEGSGSINDHMLTIYADSITAVNDKLIPFDALMAVEGTPFDFRESTEIGARVNTPENEQLKNAGGYDHNWVLARKTASEVEKAVELYDPKSGRVMEVLTDQPGVQFYGGNFFDGSTHGKTADKIGYREFLALETQHFPDSPNHPSFPTTRLNPGETYHQTCIYRFSVR